MGYASIRFVFARLWQRRLGVDVGGWLICFHGCSLTGVCSCLDPKGRSIDCIFADLLFTRSHGFYQQVSKSDISREMVISGPHQPRVLRVCDWHLRDSLTFEDRTRPSPEATRKYCKQLSTYTAFLFIYDLKTPTYQTHQYSNTTTS